MEMKEMDTVSSSGLLFQWKVRLLLRSKKSCGVKEQEALKGPIRTCFRLGTQERPFWS